VAPVTADVSEELTRGYVPPKRQMLQKPHGVTSQKTAFFTVIAPEASNLSQLCNGVLMFLL
jgi:hypothetical protein